MYNVVDESLLLNNSLMCEIVYFSLFKNALCTKKEEKQKKQQK